MEGFQKVLDKREELSLDRIDPNGSDLDQNPSLEIILNFTTVMHISFPYSWYVGIQQMRE